MQPLPPNRIRRNQIFNIAVLIATMALIGGTFLLVEKIKDSVLPQNCHMAGFTNCGSVGLPPPDESAPSRVIRVPASER
jgi:hypothetical protein